MRISVLSMFLMAMKVAAIIYPEMEVGRDELGWQPGETPRIQHPERCRPRPPSTKHLTDAEELVYIVGVVREDENGTQGCHFVVFDAYNVRGAEATMDPAIENFHCKPLPLDSEPNCPLIFVVQSMFMIFCANDGNYVHVTVHLVELTEELGVFVLRRLDAQRLGHFFTLNSKQIMNAFTYRLDMYSYSTEAYFYFMRPDFSLTVKFMLLESSMKLKYRAFMPFGGANTEEFEKCNNTENGGDFSEFTETEPVGNERFHFVYNPINGAFNQVRRGLVHYEATNQITEEGADDLLGFIVENYNMTNGTIESQKCFYSPEFNGTYGKAVNLIPMTYMNTRDWNKIPSLFWRDMIFDTAEVEPEPMDFDLRCETAIFTKNGTHGLPYKIIGMEPLDGLPAIAIYDGFNAEPQHHEDPNGVIRENCLIEQNHVSTALVHFGIRVLSDGEHFVVFCNRNYEPLGQMSDEDRNRTSTVFLFHYTTNNDADNPVASLTLKSMEHLRVDEMNAGFIDNRGLLMLPIPSASDPMPKIYYFVQMQPCVVFSLNMESMSFTIRPPNQKPNQLCEEAELPLYEMGNSTQNLDYNWENCIQRNCFTEFSGTENYTVISMEPYDPHDYYTVDVVRSNSSFVIGQHFCIVSSFHYVVNNETANYADSNVNSSGTFRYVYKFAHINETERQPCFAPSNLSSSFQLITFVNCEMAAAFTIPPPTIANGHVEAKLIDCKGHFVDTIAGVGLAAAIMSVCAAAFIGVVVAVCVGKRRNAQPEQKTPTQTPAATTATGNATPLTPKTPVVPQPEGTPARTPTTPKPKVSVRSNVESWVAAQTPRMTRARAQAPVRIPSEHRPPIIVDRVAVSEQKAGSPEDESSRRRPASSQHSEWMDEWM